MSPMITQLFLTAFLKKDSPAFQLICNILTDTLLWIRTDNALFFMVTKVYDPKGKNSLDWEAAFYHHGYTIAFTLLGLNREQHEKLRQDLIDCVYRYAFKKGKADQLAYKVGKQWVKLLTFN